jgi:endoribonuclease Dicer
LFAFARDATSHLGEWCADHFWFMALADQESFKVERKLERTFLADKENRPIHLLDVELSRVREAKEFVHDWIFAAPKLEENILSPKVLLLHKYLGLIFEKPSDARCIIFVKRRYTARLLMALFTQIGSPLMRLGLLIGTRYGDPGDVKISFRQQVLTLTKFRKGEINCLVR